MKKTTKKELSQAEIQDYDLQIRNLINAKLSKLNESKHLSELVRNTHRGRLRGNLVSDIIRVLKSRLFSNPMNPDITSYDPDFQDSAEEAEIVAESIMNISGLSEQVYDAVVNATWNGVGFLYVSHPLDPINIDPVKTVIINRMDNTPAPLMKSNYVEAMPGEEAFLTGEPEEFDAFSQDIIPENEKEPEPVFDLSNGHPYIESVDPRLILYNDKAKTLEGCDFIVRLRPLTIAEIKKVIGFDVPKNSALAVKYKSLFDEVYGFDTSLFPEMVVVAEVWIQRNRNNPDLSNHYLCYVIGDSNVVIYNKPNINGSMLPFIAVKVEASKQFGDDSLAKEARSFAETYDIGVQAVDRNLRRTANLKFLVTKSAGLDDKNKKRITDDNYTGPIEANDPEAIQTYKENSLDQMFMWHLGFYKNLAQSSHGMSDIDRGIAIKDITAKQTQALLDSTSVSMEGMKAEIEKAVKESLLKLMFMAGKYSYLSQTRQYNIGGRIASVQPGKYDYVTSYIYNINIRDTGDVAPEKVLAMNQLLRTIQQDPVLRQKFNTDELARFVVRTLKIPPTVLASRSPQLEQDQNLPLQDMGGGLEETHPERMIGDRGINVANAMQGQLNIGVKR